MILTVKVRPNARKNRIVSWEDRSTVVVDIAATPSAGKANRELINFFAQEFNVAKSLIEIIRGHRAKVKHLRLPDGTNIF